MRAEARPARLATLVPVYAAVTPGLVQERSDAFGALPLEVGCRVDLGVLGFDCLHDPARVLPLEAVAQDHELRGGRHVGELLGLLLPQVTVERPDVRPQAARARQDPLLRGRARHDNVSAHPGVLELQQQEPHLLDPPVDQVVAEHRQPGGLLAEPPLQQALPTKRPGVPVQVDQHDERRERRQGDGPPGGRPGRVPFDARAQQVDGHLPQGGEHALGRPLGHGDQLLRPQVALAQGQGDREAQHVQDAEADHGPERGVVVGALGQPHGRRREEPEPAKEGGERVATSILAAAGAPRPAAAEVLGPAPAHEAAPRVTDEGRQLREQQHHGDHRDRRHRDPGVAAGEPAGEHGLVGDLPEPPAQEPQQRDAEEQPEIIGRDPRPGPPEETPRRGVTTTRWLPHGPRSPAPSDLSARSAYQCATSVSEVPGAAVGSTVAGSAGVSESVEVSRNDGTLIMSCW